MKQTKLIMGMPITIDVDIKKKGDGKKILKETFDYFHYVDEKFSPFKKTSELTKINNGEIEAAKSSLDMRNVLQLCEKTKQQTKGYFDIITAEGKINPSGLVKGWSILNAAKMISAKGVEKFYVEAGGDIQTQGKYWKIGIKNPFDQKQIIKVVYIKDMGIATSGTYIRGQHIYNPFNKAQIFLDIVSLTVIGPDIYEADRFATAAFAMGREGIYFIEKLDGFEGYMIDANGQATMTTNFEKYTEEPQEKYAE